MSPSPSCPDCGKASDHLLDATDTNRRLGDDPFTYWQCTGCGLVFMDPVPGDIGRYYAGGYQSIPTDMKAFESLCRKDAYRLDLLRPYKSGGRLLEIGPWIGIFSFNAQQSGFTVDAIEMNPDACSFLRNKLGIQTVMTNDVGSALTRMDTTYDAIVLWHSLEHLPQPWEVVRNARRLLKKDGVLLVAIPNIASAQSRFMGHRWQHLDAPRHTYFWSPQALIDLGRRSGLELLHLSTNDRLSHELEITAWQAYIRNIVRIPIVRRVVGVALAPLLTRISARNGGAGITAIFSRAPDSPAASPG